MDEPSYEEESGLEEFLLDYEEECEILHCGGNSDVPLEKSTEANCIAKGEEKGSNSSPESGKTKQSVGMSSLTLESTNASSKSDPTQVSKKGGDNAVTSVCISRALTGDHGLPSMPRRPAGFVPPPMPPKRGDLLNGKSLADAAPLSTGSHLHRRRHYNRHYVSRDSRKQWRRPTKTDSMLAPCRPGQDSGNSR